MGNRRDFLTGAGGWLFAGAIGGVTQRLARGADLGPAVLPRGTLESSTLASLPGKVPLIKKTWRPPNFETPVSYFEQLFTPNEAFFVRYHLAGIPRIEASTWHLTIAGEAIARPYQVTLAQLKSEFERVEVAAVCMCSGNRRGLSTPHVPGVEWGHGAIGNARWAGVRLKDLLARAGLKKEAVEIAFDGADFAVHPATPDFVKSLPLWKALDEHTLVAYEMNGEPLPHWNGFPARLVVAGWTATYWIKHLTAIRALSAPFAGFWMNPAYRIPKGRFPVVDRFITQETETTTPITEMVVNSLITAPASGSVVTAGREIEIRGVAWDGGHGIATVEVSADAGESWQRAALAAEHGRFSWRQWSYRMRPQRPGRQIVMARASNRAGTTQTFELIFNPAGYHNNVVQTVELVVT
ncbi:MAG TPA: molybdopterin-dependent oxidoreductase [Burkholderiales bacterium]|jgi:DMSO/TMAO reductase YedYZ molybdopterin-dependent catalytic subunit|nr:molybdopterin-dependent oxidoreductase [Burkholderiales bacterium]